MTTFLMVQGMEPVALDEDEKFNKVRQRVNQAVTGTDKDGDPKEGKAAARPLHELTFKTAEGGRFAPIPEKLLGVGSDEEKDVSSEDDE